MAENYLKTAGEAVLNNAVKVILSTQRLDTVDWLTKQQVERVRKYILAVMEKSLYPVEVKDVQNLSSDVKKADVAVQNNAIKVILNRQRLDEIKWLTRQQIERVRIFIEWIMEKSPHPVEVDNPLGLLLNEKDKGASADKTDDPISEDSGDSGELKSGELK